VTNRRGEMQRFPLLSISIGIATTDLRSYAHYAEAVGGRHRDEVLHEDLGRLVVGGRPPYDLSSGRPRHLRSTASGTAGNTSANTLPPSGRSR
jgi:hypothetical protein